MKNFFDYEGRAVRLTEERQRHILEHPEMTDLESAVEETVKAPERVIRSLADDTARLFYRFREKTVVGAKWLCVVVKYSSDDAFVLTAYLTDTPKKGEQVLPKK